MRRINLLGWLSAALLMGQPAVAQVQLVNERLTNPAAAELYIGVPNTLMITGGKAGEHYRLQTAGAAGKLDVKGNAAVILVSSKGSKKISLYRKGKLVFSKRYQAKMVPDPVVHIGHRMDTLLSKAFIRQFPQLNLSLPGCLLKHGMQVLGFSVTFILRNSRPWPAYDGHCTGNQLSASLLPLIDQLQPQEIIRLDNIKVLGPDSRTRTLQPVNITIQ